MDETLLVEKYRTRILYFVLKKIRDRGVAEELTQDTLLVTIQALREGRVREESSVGSYIFGVAKNLILNYQRKQVRSDGAGIHFEDAVISWKDHPEAALLLRERQAELQRAFDRLSSADREILRDVFVEEDRLEDIALRLNIPDPTVRKRKSRALGRLRKIFLNLSHRENS